MKKGNILTIVLILILMSIGGYYCWNYTPVKDKIVGLIAGPPTLEDVNEYFPNDGAIELGEFKTTYFNGKKQYGFMLKRSGVEEIYVFPEDFNIQDPNKRTYIRIPKGDYVDINQDGLFYIQEQIRKMGRSADFTTVHNVHIVEKGVDRETLPLFYKMKYYDEKEKTYKYFFFLSESEIIEPLEESEKIMNFE